jgi:hypothetical protein
MGTRTFPLGRSISGPSTSPVSGGRTGAGAGWNPWQSDPPEPVASRRQKADERPSPIKALLGGNSNDALVPLVSTRGLPVIATARQRLIGVIDELWPEIDGGDVRVFSDSIVRLAISHVTAPDTGPDNGPDRVARDVSAVLRPFVEQALERAGLP